MTSIPSEHLAPYDASMISQRYRDLTEELLAWSMRLCSCRRGIAWHAQRSFVAATFEIFGALPDAAEWESLLCAKYLTFFLGVDDGTAVEVAELADQLGAGRPATGELGAMYRALLADISAHAASTSRLEHELAELCSVISAETMPDVHITTWGEFYAQRRITIGTHPYITCWRSIRGLLGPQPDPGAEELVELAVEATYLANDLASLDKEIHAAEPATSNWLRFHAQSSNDLNEAADAAVDRYNHIVATFTHAPPGPLIALLSGIVDGQLSSYLHLSTTRYPGAAAAPHRLHRIAPDESVGQ